jgi:hypothetical protein
MMVEQTNFIDLIVYANRLGEVLPHENISCHSSLRSHL